MQNVRLSAHNVRLFEYNVRLFEYNVTLFANLILKHFACHTSEPEICVGGSTVHATAVMMPPTPIKSYVTLRVEMYQAYPRFISYG